MPKKEISGRTINKIAVVNLDDEHASYFLQFLADKKLGFTIRTKYDITGVEEVRADNIQISASGSDFSVNNNNFHTPLLGEYNIYNCLAAVTVAISLGVDYETIKKTLAKIQQIPGRMEFIDSGQSFKVLVDYAPEPFGLNKLYQALSLIKKNKVIHVLGSCGGGRDRSRRPIMGEIAGKHADYVIVTNEDPYDDEPQEIINQVAIGAEKAGKILDKNLYKIADRREAIKKALALAKENDLVLITGKGCEQAIVTADNKKIPWDDRKVAREELGKYKSHPSTNSGINEN